MPDKPVKKPADEARRTNVLLESLTKDVNAVAEAVGGLPGRLDRVERTLSDVALDVDVMKPVVKSLASVPDELRSQADVLRKAARDLNELTYSSAKTNQELDTVKTELRLVRSDLTTFEKRLDTVEAKAGS